MRPSPGKTPVKTILGLLVAATIVGVYLGVALILDWPPFEEDTISGAPFSRQELADAGRDKLVAAESIAASDGIKLAYRPYIPHVPIASVIFYHGGGAHSGAGYHHIGSGLRDRFNLAVYMPDLRGHGESGGARGDAPGPKQVWMDITTMIRHVRSQHPDLPLFLGGHSSGAAVTLNYSTWGERDLVDAWVFLSPELGFRSKTAREDNPNPFATVNVLPFVFNGISGGLLFGHSKAVKFNYPAEALQAGMLGYITVNMGNALTPSAPDKQFAELDRPFGLWVGAQDELFVPKKVLAFGELATKVRADSHVAIVMGAKHISILLTAHEVIGPWIVKHINMIKHVTSKAKPA